MTMTKTKKPTRTDLVAPSVPPTPAACLFTTSEAAEVLAISTTKLAEMTKEGEIPCVRIGRAVRYDRKDLTALIERSKTRK